MMTVSNSKEPVRVLYQTVDREEFGAYPWDVGSTLFSAQAGSDEFYFMRVMFTTNVTVDLTPLRKAINAPLVYNQYEASALIHVTSGDLARGRNIARANCDAGAIAKAVRIQDVLESDFSHAAAAYDDGEISQEDLRSAIQTAFGFMFSKAYILGEHQVRLATKDILPPVPPENDSDAEA